MSKINKVAYTLNPCKNEIPENEIKIMIRAADDIVYSGGRSLLAKVLKGSKDKKVKVKIEWVIKELSRK